MNDRIVELARELIKQYGFPLLEDSERLGQLLDDKCSADRHEIFLLCFALRNVSRSGTYPSSRELLADRKNIEARFCAELGFSPFVAKWALDAIAVIIADAEGDDEPAADEPEETPMEQEGGDAAEHVEARKGYLGTRYDGFAKRPRTAPARKKALRNGLLLLAIVAVISWLFFRAVQSRFPLQGEYRVLFLAHLSGADAAAGHVRLKAAQLAADMINDQGGVRGMQLNIVAHDVPVDAGAAAASVRAILRDTKSTAMISACADDVSGELADLADEFEIPLVASESSRASSMMEGDRPYLYSFRTNIDNDCRGRTLAYFSARGLKRSRVALLTLAYDDDAREMSAAFRDEFSVGGEIVCDRNYPQRGGLDAASTAEIKSSSADCIIILDPSDGAVAAVRSIREADITAAVIVSPGDAALVDEAGDALADTWWIVPTAPDDPQLLSFQTSYRDKYNESVGRGDFSGAVLAYDTVRWMADVLHRSPGFQGEALRHSFLSTKNLGLTHATLTIDPRNHSPWNKTVALLYTSGGKTRFQRRFRPQLPSN